MIIQLSDELAEKMEKGDVPVCSLLEGLGAYSAERLYKDAGKWEARHREAGLHKWYKVEYDPALPQTKAAGRAESIPGIEYAGPVRRVCKKSIVNDPRFSWQWYLYNDGSLGSKHEKHCDVNVLPVWNRFTAGDKRVIVAVVDGGVDLNHEDLAAVCLPGGPEGSYNFVTRSYNIVADNHGTHVAGIVGAVANNGKGGAGVAGGLDGNGGVRIMSCQVFQANPEDPEHDLVGNIYDAIVWGADHGAVICQNSWCFSYEKEEEALRDKVGPISYSIDYFIKYAGTDMKGNQTGPMKGGVVIFAAGNDAWSIGWPGAYPPVVAVGSVAPDFTPAYYTNHGDWVDIAAPGGSAFYDKGQIYSTLKDNKYGWFQGTSMACPNVSGVAALIVSYYGKQGFTNEMLLERLLKGANADAINGTVKIGPLCDAFGSMAYGSVSPPATPGSHSVTAKSNSLTFSVRVPSDPDEMLAYGVVMLASKNKASLERPDLNNLPADVVSVHAEVGDLSLNDELTATVSGLDFLTEYYTAVAAYDFSGNYSGLTPVIQVTTGANLPPVISSDYNGPIRLKAHETITLDVDIQDPDGHGFGVAFVSGNNSASSKKKTSGSFQLTLTGRYEDAGKYEAKYVATDEFGAVSTAVFEYEILPNHDPELIREQDELLFTTIGQSKTLDMSGYLYDPDGEQLSYKISAAPAGVVSLTTSLNSFNVTALTLGNTILTVSGVDVKGKKATVNFRILVRTPDADPDVYPSYVSDFLKISDGVRKTLLVSICSAAGVNLYEGNFTCDAFEPAVIDMRNWAPGRYSVSVVSEGKKVTSTVIKL
ncbi:MAG: S8 family serine peptidase [Bacteroidales bacterium]|nr:S8 family serine peptidase [Bacteroidales bacterium]